MPSSDSKAPFEKFHIYTPPSERQADGFIVIVEPNAKMFFSIHDEQSAKELQSIQSRFIESAIREKLERERKL